MIIDDDAIDSVAAKLRCSFAAEHRKFLQSTSSCDLHACPGSGKTTLLVAKLALLAPQWPWRDRGILVLSHTNVARREVEQRLARDAAGATLLGYPHFIGTIQGFVDRFLALPFLRDNGEVAPRIDDELFASRASNLFFSAWGWKNCKTARQYLKRSQPRDEGRGLVASLHYSGADLALGPISRVPGDKTPTNADLRTLKKAVSKEGVFRFADMFAFAARALKRRPYLLDALRRRFPWVFIDEMQDTSKEQSDLLESIFAVPAVVFHKIGDQNQSIFAESAIDSDQMSLAWTGSIDLPQSQRLAPKLAELVSPLTVVHPQVLAGNPARRDRLHTVFVFEDATISGVLPAFASLVLDQWGGRVPADFVAKAVGFRRTPTQGATGPGSLGDYWSDFAAAPAEDRPPRTNLLATVRHARRLAAARGEFHGAHRLVLDALCRVIELQEGAANGRITRRVLLSRCEAEVIDQIAVKDLISRLLRTDCAVVQSDWKQATDEMQSVLLPSATANADVQQYVGWEEPSEVPRSPSASTMFVHRIGDATVAIEVATIHAVKGETHDATLVLETQFYEHDIKLGIPFLAGTATLPKDKKRLTEHMKRLYVGCTRAKELLCLAVHKTHLTERDEDALRRRGWRIHAVPTSIPPESADTAI